MTVFSPKRQAYKIRSNQILVVKHLLSGNQHLLLLFRFYFPLFSHKHSLKNVKKSTIISICLSILLPSSEEMGSSCSANLPMRMFKNKK